MKTINILLLVLGLALGSIAQAQVMGGDKGRREALKMGLYPPDLIMRHQQRLGITAKQRSNMAAAVKTFQGEVAELQWTLQSEQQTLKQTVNAHPIDTDQALQKVDDVLRLENEFKRAHFRLLIAIKNALTPEQSEMIQDEMKRRQANRER